MDGNNILGDDINTHEEQLEIEPSSLQEIA